MKLTRRHFMAKAAIAAGGISSHLQFCLEINPVEKNLM